MSSMTSGTLAPGRARITQKTLRTDKWWIPNLLTVIGLVAWITYATARVFQQNYYWGAQNTEQPYLEYLTPFYSPCISDGCIPEAAHFGTYLPDVWFIPFAAFSLPFLGLFRFTCYYYRKAYYRSFFADPIACAVGEMKPKGYIGENRFPFILQNLHRFFLYAALVFLVILWYDVIKACLFVNPDGSRSFGVGGGSLAIFASTLFLTLYTFSCHSLRHIVGGKLDCFSCAVAGGPRQKTWAIVSILNEHHMAWAWWSLLAVCFADLYVRLCSMGVINDPRFF
jgi:hypothetical protein